MAHKLEKRGIQFEDAFTRNKGALYIIELVGALYGIATLCVGVGMGSSTLVEWIGER